MYKQFITRVFFRYTHLFFTLVKKDSLHVCETILRKELFTHVKNKLTRVNLFYLNGRPGPVMNE